MVRRGDQGEDGTDREPRRRRDDREDPGSAVAFAFRILNEQTPIALIAICSIAFLAWLYVTTLTAIARDLRDHTRESGWYQRQSCISLAELAGTNPSLCDQRNDDNRR